MVVPEPLETAVTSSVPLNTGIRVALAVCATHEAPVPVGEVFEVSTRSNRSRVGSLWCRTRPARRPGRVGHHAHRHGVNVQLATDPVDRLLWISPALPGRAHDLTAARTHRILRICERQDVPVLLKGLNGSLASNGLSGSERQ